MAEITLLNAINKTLEQQMEKDENVIVYGEDAGYEGGVFRVTAGLQKKFGEERVFDAPIAEGAIIGSAIGMAANGLRPVPEIQFSGFMFPGYNQIVTHMARMRNRSRGKYQMPITIRMPYGGGVNALEHHSESLETLFAHIPGLKLVIPSTPYDAKGLLTAAIQDNDPVIYFEPKRIYRAFKQEVPDEEYTVPIGKAKVVQEGDDITVVAWGAMMKDTLKVAKRLEDEGHSVEVIDLRTIAPMDSDTVIESVKKTGRFVVVHEAVKTLGIGSELISRVNEGAFFHLEAQPTRVTGFDITIPLPKGEHHQTVSEEKIYKKLKEVATFK
ncbi:MAG: alpha-ketoacid dehydrogenase subunit beta [Bacillota bacterium]